VKGITASFAPAAFCAGVSRGFVTPSEDGILISLRVSPGAKRTSIDGPFGESAIRLRAAAPPVDGKANAEIERFLAELLGTSSSDVSVLRGASSRDKVVRVRGLGEEEIRKILSPYLH
jgi:uncharacterized protein (TIGR00251 family)